MKIKDYITYMHVAEVFAERSYARRLKVGAVAVFDNRILGEGYNGTLPGQDNNCENSVIDPVTGKEILTTKEGVIHSEANVIAKLAKYGSSAHGATLFCTHACCTGCARLIVASGFTEFVFRDHYRSTEGLELLRENNVKIIKISDLLKV